MIETLGTRESDFCVADGALRADDVLRALADAERSARPVAVCGTAFAFVHLLEALQARDVRHPLPARSRVMETGGFKGRAPRAAPRSRSTPGSRSASACPGRASSTSTA